MQCTQIGCSKEETEITDYKAEKTKKVDIKLKFHHCSIKKVYNRAYEAILTIIKSSLNNDIIKKKR